MGVTFDQQQQLSVHHQRLSAQRQYIVQQAQKIEDLQQQLGIQRAAATRQAAMAAQMHTAAQTRQLLMAGETCEEPNQLWQ